MVDSTNFGAKNKFLLSMLRTVVAFLLFSSTHHSPSYVAPFSKIVDDLESASCLLSKASRTFENGAM